MGSATLPTTSHAGRRDSLSAPATLASAAALAELARRGGGLVARERPALIAIAGITAYGSALMGYYVDRSLDHILIYVALPIVLTGALWLGLLLRCGDAVGRAARTAGLALSLAVAVLVVAVAWSSIGPRFPRTALAHAAPGGSSLRGALERLWHPPPLAPAPPPASGRWLATCRAKRRAS